jgi:Fe-S cluster biogenesis protein NfuA
MNSGEFQAHTKQLEECVQRANDLADERARSTALELMQSLMDLHGSVMSRMIELLAESGESGRNLLAKLGGDPLICGLLVLYGIHPLTLEERVSKAIVKLQPQLKKQGGSLELIDCSDASIKVKVQNVGHGCGSSPDALRKKVEEALREAAPEAVEIIMEGALPSAFVPLSMIQPGMKEEKSYEKSTA